MQHYNHFNKGILSLLLTLGASLALAQQAANEQDDEEDIEEVIVVGSQIKGADVRDILAVSFLSTEDIDLSGVNSADDLLALLPEHGQNYFNDAETISGGVNSARGDIGAFNLRNLGTGNTLVLLNGRRVANASTFQTESVGGSFVPVVTANSNEIPVSGVSRVEVLRDGASAIYGADAVAGVVNTVLKSDFDGLKLRFRNTTYDNIGRGGQSLGAEWGNTFNGGDTNLGIFFSSYSRNAVSSREDSKWADADYRRLVPDDSPWKTHTGLRNTSSNSQYGQFDLVSSAVTARISGVNAGTEESPIPTAALTDSAGEFEVFPLGHANCEYTINEQICGAQDGAGQLRYNFNDNRDLSSDLERINLFFYLNHVFNDKLELFTEISFYSAATSRVLHPSSSFSSVKLEVGAANYYNPFGPTTSPNRLSDAVLGVNNAVPDEGLALIIDGYRIVEAPRLVDNDATSMRFLQGFRGTLGAWDWESALVMSSAQRDDTTHNRVSNTLLQEALNDPTAAAYNPFSGGVNTNIERALVDAFRKTESDMLLVDAKFSHNNAFDLPGGGAALLLGAEFRDESFKDDRDPRLDGTIAFTDRDGDTYPFVSDLVNSSPTPDNSGSRDVLSLFAELQLPVASTVTVQTALRYEDYSDVGDTFVGKVAAGWRIIDQITLRTSWSQAFRVPNLVTINETIVARANTRDDYVCQYAQENRTDTIGLTEMQADDLELDCSNRIQRRAQGSRLLVPEESVNTNIGLVFSPTKDMTITLDSWAITKDNTIGLIGEENHTLLELLQRLNYGSANCDNAPGYAPSGRDDVDSSEAAAYTSAGLCPVGKLLSVSDRYANLDTRTLAGTDLGFYYRIPTTSSGTFRIKYNLSQLDEYTQEPGAATQSLVAAQAAGQLPANYPISGFSDLIGQTGNQEMRQSLSVSWRRKAYGASLSMFEIGEFYQDSLTLISASGEQQRYIIPAMQTFSATFDYTFKISESALRFRLGIRNLTDERAPLADGYFGFLSDAHNDYGRYIYLDLNYRL